jgi:hypothetical protein
VETRLEMLEQCYQAALTKDSEFVILKDIRDEISALHLQVAGLEFCITSPQTDAIKNPVTANACS